MSNKLKKILNKVDRFLFKKFGSELNIKFLENLKEAKIIFSYLNGFESQTNVKFVGGCVRKALYGESINDIDLATTYEPSEVKKKLNQKDIKVIDTGIKHGTLTVIINKKKFEITTLRKDINTDGRHADINFISSWEEDSLRRDLTINSIYADINGKIFDPQNGLSDLKRGIVKFIGSSEKRIQEDYLRILRFFRFFVQYSKVDYDENVIKHIKQNINGLNKVSNERIYDEVKKILSLSNIYSLFSNDKSKEIILNIFPQFKFYTRLKFFDNLDDSLKDKYNYRLILALLVVDGTDNYEFFCYKYKLPTKIKDTFKKISRNYKFFISNKFYSENNIKKLIYFNNKSDVNDILLFSRCINTKLENHNFSKILDYIKNCKVPKFPLSGDDLKKHGYESGELLGKKLKSLEQKWVDNNFEMDENLVKKSLN